MTDVVVLQVCCAGCAGQLRAEHGLPGPGAPGRGCVWQRRVCCHFDKSKQPYPFLSIRVATPRLSCEV